MRTTTNPEIIRIYDAVPQLKCLRTAVLLEDVWRQPELAYRDRILVTLGILAAGAKLVEMQQWMRRGVEEGEITLDDLRGLVVQVAFYAGWPAGLCAGRAALDLFVAEGK